MVDNLRCGVPSNWLNDFSQCLFEWQTLIGGMLALASAVVASTLLQRQIRQTSNLEEQRLRRAFEANLAGLSLFLSEICEYGQCVAEEMKPLNNNIFAVASSTIIAGQTPIPAMALERFARIIEFSSNRSLNAILSEIISEIQILSALSRSVSRSDLLGTDRVPSNVEIYIVQCARLHALASALFSYARPERGPIPGVVGWDKVQATMSMFQVDEERHAGAWAHIVGRSSRGPAFECPK